MEQALVISSVLLWAVLLFNLLLTLALVRRLNSGSNGHNADLDRQGLKPGQSAPDFTVEKIDGTVVTNADFAGRPFVLIFVSAGCRGCEEAYPKLEALRPKAARAGVEMLLVSTADSADTQEMIRRFDLTLPTLVAPRSSNSIMQDYNVSATPFFCMVDERGKVHLSGYPNPDWGPWKEIVDSWDSTGVTDTQLQPSGRR